MIAVADMLFQPILAIDGGAVGVVVFLVISFISWIMNTVQASKQQQEAKERQLRRQKRAAAGGGAGQPRGKAAGGDRIRTEIESFLEEVAGQKQQAKPQPQRPRAHTTNPPLRSRPVKPPKLPSRTAEPAKSSLGSAPVAEREVGSGVGKHVSTYMSDRIGEHVETDIAQSVAQHITEHVSEHIGAETSTDDMIQTAPKANPAATAIRDMLKDREGVRRAILVNEILSRRTFKR